MSKVVILSNEMYFNSVIWNSNWWNLMILNIKALTFTFL